MSPHSVRLKIVEASDGLLYVPNYLFYFINVFLVFDSYKMDIQINIFLCIYFGVSV